MLEPFVILALLVAFGYGAGNVIDKALFAEYIDHARTMQFLSGLFAPIVVLPLLLVEQITVYAAVPFLLTIISGVLFFGGGYLQMKATKMGEVSEMTLLLKTIPIFTLILAALFLGERLTIGEYFGLLLIVAGSVLVTLEPRQGLPRIAPTLPNLITVCAAFLFATTFVLTKYLLNFASFINVFFWQQAGIFLAAPVMLIFLPVRRELKTFIKRPIDKGFPLFLFGTIIYAAANLINTLALRDAPASLVTAIISSDAFFVILLVAFLQKLGLDHFEEKMTRSALVLKIAAVILFIIGAFIIG